ncbi:zinc finger protein 699 [Daktulosphaira vitifoliae]|uniref:zinc finger protein 699 n=1 Tax=Daktulosphaira vitifoliae TaxID=58002 RepID=UPI0021AA4D5D|nr:zinc finger protein 699 [Daktulosphaira vitifoliae]
MSPLQCISMESANGTQKCIAGSYLPTSCATPAIDVAVMLGHLENNMKYDASKISRKKIVLSMDKLGRLVCVEGNNCPVVGCSCWILLVPLAEDCHAYNCTITLLAAGTIAMHMTSATIPGDSLRMWFPPDLQLMLHVPFLTPINIKDERKYVCHKCDYTCETPNPLKIHLALDCDKLPCTKLWSRLIQESDRIMDSSFRFSLTPESCKTSESAFRPYSPSSSVSLEPTTSPSYDEKTIIMVPEEKNHGAAMFDRRCAEMETIVSNLGHSEQGHLCIYCGKVYSRKYGLKIHIRTHTGFKPLKCKYCFRPFGDPSNLNKHVRLHAEGDTPYRCDCCGKILVRKRDFDRHMKSRHARLVPKGLFKMHVPV